MKNFFFTIVIFFMYLVSAGQQADFLVLKKNQHTIKSFFAGSQVNFLAASTRYYGRIDAIQKDSVFLTEFDIRQMPTNLGVYVIDTVARYHVAFPYNQITAIAADRTGFSWSASGASLFGGGVLLTTIGAGTWLFTKPGTRYHASPSLVIGSAILGGFGYYLLRSHGDNFKIGSKYKLQYVRVSRATK
ncbi:MAG: hypothetical protein ABJA57_07625 [Ginsengibacter sp.]